MFLAICQSRHSTLSCFAWKAVPKLATTYFLVFLSPHTKLGAQVTGGTQRKLPQCDASTHLDSSP